MPKKQVEGRDFKKKVEEIKKSPSEERLLVACPHKNALIYCTVCNVKSSKVKVTSLLNDSKKVRKI